MTTKDIIFIALGAWGAILSTYNWLRDLHDRQTRLKLSVAIGRIGDGRGHISQPLVNCTIANPSRNTITISTFGFALPNKKILAYPLPIGASLPLELAPGKSGMLAVDMADLADLARAEGFSGPVNITPICCDQIGKRY